MLWRSHNKHVFLIVVMLLVSQTMLKSSLRAWAIRYLLSNFIIKWACFAAPRFPWRVPSGALSHMKLFFAQAIVMCVVVSVHAHNREMYLQGLPEPVAGVTMQKPISVDDLPATTMPPKHTARTVPKLPTVQVLVFFLDVELIWL